MNNEESMIAGQPKTPPLSDAELATWCKRAESRCRRFPDLDWNREIMALIEKFNERGRRISELTAPLPGDRDAMLSAQERAGIPVDGGSEHQAFQTGWTMARIWISERKATH